LRFLAVVASSFALFAANLVSGPVDVITDFKSFLFQQFVAATFFSKIDGR